MKINKLSSNVFSLLFGRAIDLIVSLVSITLIARYLGAEQYGRFTSIVATVIIISKFIDFGMAPIVFRENSKAIHSPLIINNAISLRIIFLITAVLYNVLAIILNIEYQEQLFSNILFINIVISSKFMNFREILEIMFKSTGTCIS